jgi:hypothetical protein
MLGAYLGTKNKKICTANVKTTLHFQRRGYLDSVLFIGAFGIMMRRPKYG